MQAAESGSIPGLPANRHLPTATDDSVISSRLVSLDGGMSIPGRAPLSRAVPLAQADEARKRVGDAASKAG